MKKHYTLLFLLFTFWSQAQNGITYQALILNPNNEELPGVDNSRLPLVNQSICLEFKIINAASRVDYQETLTTRTDEFGMVNVIIGSGTRKAGIATQFKNINWDGTAKNLVVSFDPTGNCNQFIEISNQPFTYVPYALYAANGGATGATGAQGPAGTNGLDGKTVINGTTNPSASVGTNGDFYINTTTNSLFGPKANGLWGNGVTLVGPQGIQGLQGPQGVAGTNGLNGTNGINGLSAYQIWLNAGNTGTQAQFLISIQGPQGPQGIQGVAGPAGGPQGPAGANGANGTNGLSTYQIWLNAGNTGTEAQFLTALRGATGAQGPQGIQGIQGIQGVAGPTGSTGSSGTNGLDGKTILNGNQDPVNSTGNNGDFYINTTANTLFGPKTSGAWGNGLSLVGPQGATGNNGKNTLVTTSVEAAGANCATGGTKIEVGLDANSNGVLDISEVISSLTKYVCNGTNSNLTSNGSFYSYDYVENDLFTFSQYNDPIQTTTIQTNQKNGYLKFNLKFRSGNGTPCGSLKIISSNNDILYQSSVNCTGWSQTIGISLNSSWNNISIVVTKTSSEQSGQLILSGNFEKVLFN